MENVITALIIVGILILIVFSAAFYMLNAQAALSQSSRMMQERLSDRARTGLTTVSTATNVTGDYVQIILQNTGTTKQANLKNWDVILQYTDVNGAPQIHWYAYATQWNAQIYQTISPSQLEVIEPGILNPGEYLVIQVNASPVVGTGTTNLATVTTPNGITVQALFTH